MSGQSAVFHSIQNLLKDLIEAAKAKNTGRISEVTAEILTVQQKADLLDKQMLGLVEAASKHLGIEPSDFKLSLLDSDRRYLSQIDALKKQAGEVATLSAQAGGVLSANVDVIEQTIRVLESIDARSGGYGPEKNIHRPAKMIDRSA